MNMKDSKKNTILSGPNCVDLINQMVSKTPTNEEFQKKSKNTLSVPKAGPIDTKTY